MPEHWAALSPPTHTPCHGAASTIRATALFVVALLFLVLMAAMIALLDRPNVSLAAVSGLFWSLGLLWGILLIESLWGYIEVGDHSWRANKRLLIVILLPPFRLTMATCASPECLWLPHWGWQRIDQQLFQRLERLFAVPMLTIALLIVPILGIELWLTDRAATWSMLALTLEVGTAMIWLAFTIEYVLMLSVAELKLRYCRENWINLVIILLPLVAFLRGLQVLRATKAMRVARLLRIYRLRGLLCRAHRVLIVLNLIERVRYRNPEKYLHNLQIQLHEKEQELEQLHAKIRAVQAKIQG